MLKSESSKPPSTCPKEAFEISRRAAYEAVGEPYPDSKRQSPPKVKSRSKEEEAEDGDSNDQGMLYY